MPTLRQQIIDLLGQSEMDARDLSEMLGISEKDVTLHLPHVARSVTSQGRKMIIAPSRCLSCGYVFENRQKFSRPGRCPKCKRSRLQNPRFRIL
jgi:hypothetical protein